MDTRCIQAGTVAIVAALAVVGCGSGSNHLTKSQYVERANAICRQAQGATVSARATLDKLPPPKPGAHVTAAQFAQAAQAENAESAAMTSAASKLKALGLPTNGANLATEVSAGVAAVGADEAAVGRAAQSHDIPAAATAFARLRADADHLGQPVAALGLNACTQI